MRKITFTISGLEITATELDDGTILFELAVPEGSGADIRGLFFDINDPALVDNLQIDGADVTNDGFGEVSNLGHGNNMHGRGGANKNGKGGGPYDVGMSFGTQADDDISSTSFILSSIDGEPLTLDLIANVRFGARLTSVGNQIDSAKVTVIAPAAPDAIDDDVDAVEDTPISFDVVANDTDADGDALEIMAATDPAHGTVEIIGNEIFYTPDENFGGDFDTFDYTITDNAGGMDTATVTVFVEAVADAPTLNVETSAGASVNEIVLTITTALTDTDGSESLEIQIDEDMLPPGATLSQNPIPITHPGEVVEVILTLPEGTDADFDLVVRSISTEASNGDMAETNQTLDIIASFETNSTQLSFEATDQSIWESGGAFSFQDDRFLGVDTGFHSGPWGGSFVGGSWSYDVQIGLQSTLDLQGGSIDATVPWDISVDSFYNITTDVLFLTPFAEIVGGGIFNTEGPSLAYDLDFIFDVLLAASVEIADVDVFSPNLHPDLTVPIFDYDSQDPNQDPISIGTTSDPLSVQFAWPELDVAGTQVVPGTYSGDGASNNALNLNIDADALATTLLPGNPFDLGFDTFSDLLGTGVEASLELLDVDLFAGLNFLQEFDLTAGDLDASIMFENGDLFDFDLTSPTTFANASALDENGDGDIEFTLLFGLDDAMLHNDTDLNFNVGYNIDVLKGSWKAGILGIVESGEFGPIVNTNGAADVAQIGVYDEAFNLAFGDEQFVFSV